MEVTPAERPQAHPPSTEVIAPGAKKIGRPAGRREITVPLGTRLSAEVMQVVDDAVAGNGLSIRAAIEQAILSLWVEGSPDPYNFLERKLVCGTMASLPSKAIRAYLGVTYSYGNSRRLHFGVDTQADGLRAMRLCPRSSGRLKTIYHQFHGSRSGA